MADGGPTIDGSTDGIREDRLRSDLGCALHRRAEEVVRAVRERLEELDSHPATGSDPEVYALIAEADRLATRVIGRWIATGSGASAEEAQALAKLGESVEEFSLPRMLKAYYAWRDVTCSMIREEAERLEIGGNVAWEAQRMVEQSCDASLVQMARHFERQRSRLQGELAAERAKLAHQALHDPLTGLANRTLLHDRLRDGLEAPPDPDAVHALLYLDLDDFKAINDAYGHDAGDVLLIAVAARLRHAVRPTDTVARCGGDEFVIFCPSLKEGLRGAESLADRVLDRVNRPFGLQGNEASVSGSIGIAVATQSEDAEHLLCRADAEMYVAKQRGGGQHSAGGRLG
jgi:diguanylate cyclase (GGDEF)-like protein